MAEKGFIELPAGVFGETLLAVDVVSWCLLFLERREQWEMLGELNKHFAPFSASWWFVPSLVTALILILVAQEMRFKKFLARPGGIVVLTELSSHHDRSDWRWVRTTGFVVSGAVIVTVLAAIVGLRFYTPDDPVLSRSLPAPQVCKTADCFPPMPKVNIKTTQPIINSPTCPGGVCAGRDVNGPVTLNPPVNPNVAVITYEYNGVRHADAPGRSNADDGELGAYQEMLNLAKARQFDGLLVLCTTEKERAPEWLTPYYYAALGYACKRRDAEALVELDQFLKKAKGAPQYGTMPSQAEQMRKDIQLNGLDCR